MCSNSVEVFDSAVIVAPDWGAIFAHCPTFLTLLALAFLIAATGGAAYYGLRRIT